jgi:hypothetical protein
MQKLLSWAKINKWIIFFLLPLRVIRKVTQSLRMLSPPIPAFSDIRKGNFIKSQYEMKAWNSAFNAQCLRVIIVVVQVGAVNIYM